MIRKFLRGVLKHIDSYLVQSSGIPKLDSTLQFGKRINTFDCDGVIQINSEIGGVHPGPKDFIITGRSYEESAETNAMLLRRGIGNKVFFNNLRFKDKTRLSSGQHKADIIKQLQMSGYVVTAHFEDDPIQAEVISKNCPDVKIIMLVHNLTNMENVRHLNE